MNILKFNYKGKEIDITYQNKRIAYVHETDDGKFYQNGVNVPSRKAEDIIGSAITLFINALESINHDTTRISDTSTGEVPNSDN